jgi:hypothetical protein
MSNPAQRGAQDQRNGLTRAGETDRIQVAQLLTDAAAQGRLQMSDYEDRLTKAYAAKTYDELDRLRSDLLGSSVSPQRGGECNPAPSMLLLAILSAFERRGRWNVPKKLTTFALWGGGVIDLRYADFTSTEVEIHACSIMGGQTILLPPEVNVEINGHGVRAVSTTVLRARAHPARRPCGSAVSRCGAGSASSGRTARPSPRHRRKPWSQALLVTGRRLELCDT